MSPQVEAAAPALIVRPSKKPGLWVQLPSGLWARVGRSATENDELFRQARDRDLWFHVRAQAARMCGIPRGQSGLGAKDAVREEIILEGGQLALFNSKAANSGSATVDFTERRQLKKMRGAPGKLEILRSETRFVRSDPSFERRLRGK